MASKSVAATRTRGFYFRAKIVEPHTFCVALVVGTLINVYGQILVPAFRGEGNPFSVFAQHFSDDPGIVVVSILVAYVFPFCVTVYSAVYTRYRYRHLESRALFPDLKPDPVFRVDRSGEIIEAGETTRSLFHKIGIGSAREALGEPLFAEVLRCIDSDQDLPHGKTVTLDDQQYQVSCSVCDTAVNIYLSKSLAIARVAA